MRRWAELHEIQGVGLDINRRFIDTAIEQAVAKRIGHKLTFVHGAALDYQPAPQSFDVVMCLGATFALGGFVETLEWLARAVKPGGSFVVGDITLKHRPIVRSGPLPYEAIQAIDVIERHGGERPYAAWRLTYDEPAFRHLKPTHGCPVAESIQPRLVQLQTNFVDTDEMDRAAEALSAAVIELNG